MIERNAVANSKSEPRWRPLGLVFLLVFLVLLAAIYWDWPFIGPFKGWEGLIAAGFVGAVAWIVGYRTVHKIGEQISQAQADAAEARKAAEEQRYAFHQQMRWQTAEWRRKYEGQIAEYLGSLQVLEGGWLNSVRERNFAAVAVTAQRLLDWSLQAENAFKDAFFSDELESVEQISYAVQNNISWLDEDFEKTPDLKASYFETHQREISSAIDAAKNWMCEQQAILRNYDGSHSLK